MLAREAGEGDRHVCSASSVSTISGHMKSFQLPRKLKIASVASTGASSGTTMVREDAELARAVDARGLEQVVGNGARELADEEDAEDAGHRRHDRAAVGVDQAERLQHQEQGSIATCPGITSAPSNALKTRRDRESATSRTHNRPSR